MSTFWSEVTRAARKVVIISLACSSCIASPLKSFLSAEEGEEVKGAILSAKNSQHSSWVINGFTWPDGRVTPPVIFQNWMRQSIYKHARESLIKHNSYRNLIKLILYSYLKKKVHENGHRCCEACWSIVLVEDVYNTRADTLIFVSGSSKFLLILMRFPMDFEASLCAWVICPNSKAHHRAVEKQCELNVLCMLPVSTNAPVGWYDWEGLKHFNTMTVDSSSWSIISIYE